MNNNPSDNRIEKNYEYQYRLLRVDVKMGSSKLIATTLYNLNNFNYEGIDRTILEFKQMECSCEYDKKLILNDLLENYEVSLPLILEKCYHKFEELTEREKWIAFFLTDDIKLAEHLAEGEELKEKALKKIQEMNQDQDFILKYNTALDELQGERELAHKEGLDDGISIGREDERIEIAKKLIARKFELEDISDITGLSIDELENIQCSN